MNEQDHIFIRRILDETDLDVPNEKPFFSSRYDDDDPRRRKKHVSKSSSKLLWPYRITTEETSGGITVKLYHIYQSYDDLVAKVSGLDEYEARKNVNKIESIIRGQ